MVPKEDSLGQIIKKEMEMIRLFCKNVTTQVGSKTSRKSRLIGDDEITKKIRTVFTAIPPRHRSLPGVVIDLGEDNLSKVRQAMPKLAQSMDRAALERRGFTLDEEFRPEIPEGSHSLEPSITQ